MAFAQRSESRCLRMHHIDFEGDYGAHPRSQSLLASLEYISSISNPFLMPMLASSHEFFSKYSFTLCSRPNPANGSVSWSIEARMYVPVKVSFILLMLDSTHLQTTSPFSGIEPEVIIVEIASARLNSPLSDRSRAFLTKLSCLNATSP